jgi:hydroxymethylpyrimidine pyrophosphatase-like HAD family hydrolase
MKYGRMVVLDVDGVLAKHAEPISDEVRNLVKAISKYSEIAIASGKPAPYLEGLNRGIGLINATIIGENGGVVYLPTNLDYLYLSKEKK